jgi:inorganic pyrophosphatase
LRYVAEKYPFNYGAFPQTWENPTIKHPDTDAFGSFLPHRSWRSDLVFLVRFVFSKRCSALVCVGDNDPLDVCEVSSIQHHTGEVVLVKVLGTYAMIDEGETDWKILVIDVNDPLAEHINGSHLFMTTN